MISEFICLDEFQKSEHESTYICSLPDPDPDSDFGMVICGYINIRERIGSKEFLIKIEIMWAMLMFCQKRYRAVKNILK